MKEFLTYDGLGRADRDNYCGSSDSDIKLYIQFKMIDDFNEKFENLA